MNFAQYLKGAPSSGVPTDMSGWTPAGIGRLDFPTMMMAMQKQRAPQQVGLSPTAGKWWEQQPPAAVAPQVGPAMKYGNAMQQPVPGAVPPPPAGMTAVRPQSRLKKRVAPPPVTGAPGSQTVRPWWGHPSALDVMRSAQQPANPYLPRVTY